MTHSGAQSVVGLAGEALRDDADDVALAGAAQLNPAAFVILYERYADRIHRYCYLIGLGDDGSRLAQHRRPDCAVTVRNSHRATDVHSLT